jgi:hypothetical protein
MAVTGTGPLNKHEGWDLSQFHSSFKLTSPQGNPGNDVSRHLLTVSRAITEWSQGDSNP